MPRPRGGDWLEDEIQSWRQSGIEVIVSLLTPDEVADLDLTTEQELCRANRIEFISFPIADRSVPSSMEAFSHLVSTVVEQLAAGKNTAVHCRQGIGRAALVAICALILSGTEVKTAIGRVSTARGCGVPETLEQRHWIDDYTKALVAQAPK
jgi:protein-tyrosine phosphatase